MRIVHFLLTIALLTSSFDIFLVLNVGGASLRLCQILLLLVMAAAAAQVIQRGRLLWPRGGSAILVWCLIQGVLTARSVIPLLSLQLYLLMLLPILGVFAVLQLYGRSLWVERLMRIYILSFVGMACFGIFQFVAPALHLGWPWITQWILHGLIPRINGFSYEPSFYATYMIMGWIALLDLRLEGARIVAGRRWFWLLWLVSVALFLSTSKTAWLFMMLEGFLRFLPRIRRFVRKQSLRFSVGSLRVPLPGLRTVVGLGAAFAVGSVMLIVLATLVNLSIFLAGTGLSNTGAHSVNIRLQQFEWTAQVVREHPLLGVSLGGVAGRVAEIKGAPVHSVSEVKVNWGFPVPVEVFAASGLLGFIPFFWFFAEITWGERHLLRAHPRDERALWLHAMIRALCFEWLCLFADQNLVRMYLWFHVTILMVVAYHLRYSIGKEAAAEDLKATRALI